MDTERGTTTCAGTLTDAEFRALYTGQYRRVFHFILRIVGDRETAEDLCQETFLKVLRYYPSYRRESQVSTWIFSIAKNAALQHVGRSRKKSFTTIERLIREELTARKQFTPYEQNERQWYIEQVKNGCLSGLLLCLPFTQRAAFILHILNDLSIDEVAAVLKKSANATRILIHRARKELRAFLCANCSLYNPTAPCRCEQMIGFSLRGGFIERYGPNVSPERITEELRIIGDEVRLFRSLPETGQRSGSAERLLEVLWNADRKILAENVK